jgi:hypothetical protein
VPYSAVLYSIVPLHQQPAWQDHNVRLGQHREVDRLLVEGSMNSGIYLIQDNGQLVQMTSQAYDSEALLQGLLATYPSLLAGDQIDTAVPRRWLLISREAPIPAEEGGVGRWAVDHLFLDQDGIPTLVEVKRSTDTRIRREVVGQMLDYAANAVVYWPVEAVRAQFIATCASSGCEPDQILAEFLGADADPDTFWHQVKTNLQVGKVRMIFVADESPAELQRIVEFLNQQMDPAQVLAVEIKQYVGQQLRTLVPRVIGLTQAARDTKSPTSAKRKTTRTEFLAKCPPPAIRVFERVLNLASEHNHTIYWGEVGFSIRVRVAGQLTSFVYGYPPNKLEVYLGYLPYSDTELRELRTSLLAFGVFRESGEKTLSVLLQDDTLPKLDGIYDFLFDHMRKLAQIT